jgi:TolA-binding protein
VRDRPFRVVTDRFVVEVVGTSFRVDVEGVRVTHGTVLVRRAGSEEILRRVSAGESWRIDDDARRSARPSTAEPEPGEPGAPTAASSAASADSDVARPGAPRALDAATLLEQARRALAAGDAIAARAAAEAALAARPSRDDAAEARMLLAECAQLAGDAERAADLYLVVARRYPELAAAETASFAAARLRANAGRTDAARSLLSAYLDRYPSGRFRREATARLRALEESP